MRIKSESDKRLIVEGEVNRKSAYFLIDTGASVGLIDERKVKEYNLRKGRSFNGTIIGAGGEMKNVRHCDTSVFVAGRQIPQFLLADIKGVVESIEHETGIEILGIISLPQMKIARIGVDTDDMDIIIE